MEYHFLARNSHLFLPAKRQLMNMLSVLVSLTLILVFSLPAIAQLDATSDDVQLYARQQQLIEISAQLRQITTELNERVQRQDSLRQSVEKTSDEETKAQLKLQLEELEASQGELNTAFEQLVVGDLDIEESDEEDVPFNWREEVLAVLRPLIESLKDITEKPRRLEELRASIERYESQAAVADEALASIEEIKAVTTNDATMGQLTLLGEKWTERKKENIRRKEVAQVSLARIDAEDGAWWTGIGSQIRGFFAGRGLTLIMMIAAGIAAWQMMRLLWWIYTTKLISRQRRRRSTRHRVLAYAYHLLTSFVVVLAAMLVLYVRSDLVLLALAIIIFAGLAISLRNMVANYVHEARLLLDLGPVREGERLIYQGLPWQVMSLNVLTILRNPELEGVLRVPLHTLHQLTSREFSDNLWFPSSAEDIVFLPDGTFATVLKQTPEAVSVRVKGGMTIHYPSADYYTMAIINISRGETFGVSTTFGVGYAHQAISLSEIPTTFHAHLERAFAENELDTALQSLLVDLSTAGASSLDYVIWAQFNSDAASQYYRIQRIMQQTCIAVCTEKNWDVPYPQMSVHVAKSA